MLTQAYDFIQLDFIPSVLTILEKHVHDHQPDEVLISELKIRVTQSLIRVPKYLCSILYYRLQSIQIKTIFLHLALLIIRG